MKEFLIQLSYLRSEPENRQHAVQDIIRKSTFATQGQLPANSSQCFLFCQAVSLPGSLELYGLIRGHHDDTIHSFVCLCFNQESRIVNNHGIRMLPGDGVHLPDLFASYARVHDAIQDRQLPGMMKDQFGQGGSIQRAVGLKHAGSEYFDNLFPGRFARGHHGAGQLIGMNDERAAFLKQACHRCLS